MASRTSEDSNATDADFRQALAETVPFVLNMVECAVIALNKRGDVVFLNAIARHFLEVGVSDPPFRWTSDLRFSDPPSGPDAARSALTAILSGQPMQRRLAVMSCTTTDERRFVRATTAPLGREHPEAHCLLVLEDVTEAELQKQQLETTARLDALGQMTGGIAHDFNNILATIQYALDLAERDLPETTDRSYLEVARTSVNRGSDLTKRLLAFAKQRPNAARALSVEDVFQDVRTMAEPFIGERIGLCTTRVTEDLWVYCDRAQLENALLNLILNSRDAMQGCDGPATIHLVADAVPQDQFDAVRPHRQTGLACGYSHPEGGNLAAQVAEGGIVLEVRDNGQGMDKTVRDRAIDPFFTTKPSDVGSGLGLPMVVGFIRNSGGGMQIASTPGQGTSVRLFLPAAHPQPAPEPKVRKLPTVPVPGKHVVLVVEDEASLSLMVQSMIVSLGYECLQAKSADCALRKIDDNKVDLVLSDIMMPGSLTGAELYLRLKADKPDLPVILMTGQVDDVAQTHGVVGATILSKPCAMDELAHALAVALESDNRAEGASEP